MKSDRTLNQPRKSWYLKLVDRSGRPRYDVSPLWADHKAFAALVHDIKDHFKDVQYDYVVALDALGFILGGAIAMSSSKGLIPLRKGDKLPLAQERLFSVQFEDYGETQKRLELVKDLIKSGRQHLQAALELEVRPDKPCVNNIGDRVLLVDEWIGTGAQMKAAVELMEQAGAVIVGIAVLYVFPDEPGNFELLQKYETFAANCLVCKHIDCAC